NGNTEAGLGMPPHMRAETGVPAGVIEEFTKFGIPPIMQPVAIAFITHRLGICRSFVEYPWVLYCLQHGIMTCQHVTAQTPVPCSSETRHPAAKVGSGVRDPTDGGESTRATRPHRAARS